MQYWYKTIPPLTKVWFTLIVAIPVAGGLHILTDKLMYLDWNSLFTDYEIWRLVTATFYYPISTRTGVHYLVTVYFIYTYSFKLEDNVFTGRPADYIYMMIFSWLACFCAAMCLNIGTFMDMSMFVVLYVYCMLYSDVKLSFWFGSRFRGRYFPWIVLLARLLIEHRFISELVGIAVGHFYYFLKFKYPIDCDGPSFLQTPRFLYKLFPSAENASDDEDEVDRDQLYRAKHVWGEGIKLVNPKLGNQAATASS